jgi:hypothetical protein
VRPGLGRLVREPLVHFAAGGLLIFALHARVAARPADDRVVVSAAFSEALAREHAQRTGRAPTAEEARALVDRFVDEEVLTREAVVLGLDRGDPIVRRRLAQKMGFLAEGDAAREPEETDLAGYLAAHADRYRSPPRVSFRHVFLGREKSGDAERLLAELRGGARPDALGEPFLRGAHFAARAPAEVEAVFGAAFAAALAGAPEGSWSGPFASSYGTHLVFVEERTPGAPAALAEARARVRQDLLDERREAAQREQLRRLRARYRVEIEAPRR